MFAMFILVLFYRYDRVTTSLWIRYPEIVLSEGLRLASVHLQIILWLRNTNMCISFFQIGENRLGRLRSVSPILVSCVVKPKGFGAKLPIYGFSTITIFIF
jgi:hypothetical protein